MIIVITLPYFFDGEAEQIVQLLHSSVDLVHIRKPQSSVTDLEKLICDIPSEYHRRLVIHDHHELALKYNLYGIHLNSRNPLPLKGWKGSISKSCHTMDEVMIWKDKCDYVSLSPIFDSISKKGYKAAFTVKQIDEARKQGVIDHRVLALGGVTFNKIDDVLRMGFGGVMIMGDAWKNMKQTQDAVALTIAGSDSSAGAGIQQDMKTMSAVGVYCATAITAITSQNTLGVKSVWCLPSDVVANQIDAVLCDLNVRAVKIGMIPNVDVAKAIVGSLKEYKSKHYCDVIYDPVMVSTSGARLMETDCTKVVCEELLPICTLITPNIPETECILRQTHYSDVHELTRKCAANVLVKGGHKQGECVSDILYLACGEEKHYTTERIDTHNLHGTGCTLSSAIAAYVVKECRLDEAVEKAKTLLAKGIRKGAVANIGKGNGPLLF